MRLGPIHYPAVLGYSTQVAFLHASKAAEPWARYAGRSVRSP